MTSCLLYTNFVLAAIGVPKAIMFDMSLGLSLAVSLSLVALTLS
jgi:hypothetical protein